MCMLYVSERKVLRDCYMYPARCKLSLRTRGSRADQRISLISSTSSNTTSGIVSDRVHSEDEPDAAGSSGSTDDSLVPAKSICSASSTVDGECQTISSRSGTLSGPSLLTELDAANGSGAASTCSTVVVNVGATATLLNAAAAATDRRRASPTSSLELGYSHTAQNSALSAVKYAGELI